MINNFDRLKCMLDAHNYVSKDFKIYLDNSDGTLERDAFWFSLFYVGSDKGVTFVAKCSSLEATLLEITKFKQWLTTTV